jgi:oligoendopeptidase F
MVDKWDLSKIYATEKDFDKDLEHLKKDLTPAMAALEGKFNDEDSLAKYLDLEKDLEYTLSKLYMFASCRSDLNKKDVKNATALAKVQLAVNDLQAATSFESPEILALGEEKIKSFVASHPAYQEFDYSFTKLFREEKHVLSGEKEKLISAFNPLLDEGGELYSNLSAGDYSPREVTLEDGSKVKVSQSNWINLIADSKSAKDRQTIFEGLYSYYDDHKNTYGEIYKTTLASELATQKSRGYSSILEEHLYGNAIPTSVFLNLVEAAKKGSAPLKKYYQIRAKYLGLAKHRSYDRFLQLAHSDKKYSYEEAKELFFNSVASFPSDFVNKAHEVLKEGYVDVYPGEGKRTGAYSTGGDNIHPFILFNFEHTLDDCFTVAHESGHSIHTLYSEESQPLMKQGYTIFVAEIASTFNEHNLLDYFLKQPNLDRQTKICLLQKAIDEITGTFYRQTLFGEYEYIVSQMAEKGEPINYEVLSKTMTELYKEYYGIDITEEKLKPLVWAYIPHLFYTPFYVYQYATSFTASMLLYENVKNKVPGAFDRYTSLLKSGGSTFPIEEVKAAGVDLTSKAPFEAVIRRMNELVDELEKTLNEK